MISRLFGAIIGAIYGLIISFIICFIIRLIFGENAIVNIISWIIILFWVLGGAYNGLTDKKE